MSALHSEQPSSQAVEATGAGDGLNSGLAGSVGTSVINLFDLQNYVSPTFKSGKKGIPPYQAMQLFYDELKECIGIETRNHLLHRFHKDVYLIFNFYSVFLWIMNYKYQIDMSLMIRKGSISSFLTVLNSIIDARLKRKLEDQFSYRVEKVDLGNLVYFMKDQITLSSDKSKSFAERLGDSKAICPLETLVMRIEDLQILLQEHGFTSDESKVHRSSLNSLLVASAVLDVEFSWFPQALRELAKHLRSPMVAIGLNSLLSKLLNQPLPPSIIFDALFQGTDFRALLEPLPDSERSPAYSLLRDTIQRVVDGVEISYKKQVFLISYPPSPPDSTKAISSDRFASSHTGDETRLVKAEESRGVGEPSSSRKVHESLLEEGKGGKVWVEGKGGVDGKGGKNEHGKRKVSDSSFATTASSILKPLLLPIKRFCLKIPGRIYGAIQGGSPEVSNEDNSKESDFNYIGLQPIGSAFQQLTDLFQRSQDASAGPSPQVQKVSSSTSTTKQESKDLRLPNPPNATTSSSSSAFQSPHRKSWMRRAGREVKRARIGKDYGDGEREIASKSTDLFERREDRAKSSAGNSLRRNLALPDSTSQTSSSFLGFGKPLGRLSDSCTDSRSGNRARSRGIPYFAQAEVGSSRVTSAINDPTGGRRLEPDWSRSTTTRPINQSGPASPSSFGTSAFSGNRRASKRLPLGTASTGGRRGTSFLFGSIGNSRGSTSNKGASRRSLLNPSLFSVSRSIIPLTDSEIKRREEELRARLAEERLQRDSVNRDANIAHQAPLAQDSQDSQEANNDPVASIGASASHPIEDELMQDDFVIVPAAAVPQVHLENSNWKAQRRSPTPYVPEPDSDDGSSHHTSGRSSMDEDVFPEEDQVLDQLTRSLKKKMSCTFRAEEFKCPLTGKLLQDPQVNLNCGHYYSRNAAYDLIDVLLPDEVRCPLEDCNKALETDLLRPADDQFKRRLAAHERALREQEAEAWEGAQVVE